MTPLIRFSRTLAFLVATLLTQYATAADELLLYVFADGAGLEGANVVVDGVSSGKSRSDGSFSADLNGGVHVIAITGPTGKTAVARFATGSGLLANVLVNLDDGNVRVQVFPETESAIDRRDAPVGNMTITVRKGLSPAANQRVVFSGAVGAVSTNANGEATTSLPRGMYTVAVGEISARVRVVGGVTRGALLNLPEEQGFSIDMPTMEEVFVIASFDPGSFEVSERDTSNIVDTIGVEMLARFADSDVAASVVRVPGISVQDDKYVFIRGLGGRYVSSTLNNATMPSTNPSKRTVPLDLFPSNFVNQLDIKKTFLPYMPGESTGGNLVINTKTFPNEAAGRVYGSLGYTSGLTGETVAVDPISGTFDVIGWDDGSREENAAVRAIADVLAQGTFVAADTGETYELTESTSGELRRLGAVLIKDGFDLDTQQTTPDVSFGVDYGDLFYLDNAEVGFYSAVNYSNEWNMRDNGIRRSYTPTGDLLNDFDYQQTSNVIETSGLFSVGVNVGNSTYEWNNVVSRVTESQVERVVGIEGDEFQTVYRQTIQWEERQYLSTQLLGSHFLNEDGSVFGEWQFTASQARRYAPDRRESEFRAAGSQTNADELSRRFDFGATNDDQPLSLDGFFLEPGIILRRYDELTDNNFDGAFDLTWDLFDSGSSFAKLRAGVQAIYRERDSESHTYGFNINQSRDDLLDTTNVLVSDVIYACGETSEITNCVADGGGISNSPNTGFVLVDKTLASDSYDAELEYNSAYFMVDQTWDTTWQVVTGARYEDYKQTTNTFSLQGEGGAVQSVIDESNLLPSLGVNWFYSEEQQLRLALSQTVARPDFKEAANATFYDNEFNIRVRGNPFLKVSTIINADLRWEWYFNDQDSLSVAAFYKEMDKPIERVVQPASGTAGNTRTFQNSEKAELYGIEVEGRKEFVLSDDYSQTVFVSFNAALIESEVIAGNQATRALQGQPEYTANLVIGYDNIDGGHQLTLLLNQNGISIADVGVSGAPDVYLEPRMDVNLVYRYAISDSATIKAKVENILNTAVQYTQGGETFQKYQKGTTFQVGIDWEL